MPRQSSRTLWAAPPWSAFPARVPSLLTDLPVVLAGLALFYGLVSLGRYWAGPVNPQPPIGGVAQNRVDNCIDDDNVRMASPPVRPLPTDCLGTGSQAPIVMD